MRVCVCVYLKILRPFRRRDLSRCPAGHREGLLCNETGTQPRKRAIARPAGMDSVEPPGKREAGAAGKDKERERERIKNVSERERQREKIKNVSKRENEILNMARRKRSGSEWRRSKGKGEGDILGIEEKLK